MKNTSKGKVLSNSVIYSISGIMLKCFSFFLLPLYTAYLTTDDYGVINIANSFLATFGFIVAFSLYSAIARFYVDLKDTPEKLKRFYGSVVSFVGISSCFFFLLFTLTRQLLSKYVFSGVDYYPVILVCLLSLIFNCQHTIYDNVLRSQQKAIKCSVLVFAMFFIQIALNVFFVVFKGMGATGVLLATLIANVLYTAYFISDMIIHKEIIFCIDFPLLKDALKYSVPIMPHNLSTYIATLISNVLIGNTASLGSLGVYSVAAQFGGITDTVQNYVNTAYAPWLYEVLHEKKEGYKSTIRDVASLLSSVIGLMLICVSLFAQDFILLFLRQSYHYAWRYVPLIVAVFTVKLSYYFYINILFYYKKASRILFVSTLSSSLINILLSSFLIPAFHAYGSILADFIAMIIRVVIVVIISRSFDDIGLRIRDFILKTILILTFSFGGLLLSYFVYKDQFSIYNLLFKIFICMVYCAIMLLPYKKKIVEMLGRKRAKKLGAQDE